MSLKSNGISFIAGVLLCACLAYKLYPESSPNVTKANPAPQVSTEDSVSKTYDKETGKLIGEVITKKQTPIPQPKPRYKVTLIPAYNFLEQKMEWMGLYEKRYVLPIIGECYLGLFASSRLTLGVSISKEFY